MKGLSITLIIIGVFFASVRGVFRYYADWDYESSVYSYWSLSEKASTIVQKVNTWINMWKR